MFKVCQTKLIFSDPNCRRPLNPDFQQIPGAEETLIQGRKKVPSSLLNGCRIQEEANPVKLLN